MAHGEDQLQEQKGLQKGNGSKETNRKGRCGATVCAVQSGLDADICCKRRERIALDRIEL